MDVFLGDALSADQRRKAAHVASEHAFVHWEEPAGVDNAVAVVVIGSSFRVGVALRLQALLFRRRSHQLVVAEYLAAFDFRSAGRAEGSCSRLLIRIQ